MDGSPGGGSGGATSDVTTVTTDGATSGATGVSPRCRPTACAHGQRCGSSGRHPPRRRDVCAHVCTYGGTDVVDPGGNTGELSPLMRRMPACHPGVGPVVSQSNARDPYATWPCLRAGQLPPKGRFIGRQSSVRASGVDPYMRGQRCIRATLIHCGWGRGPGGRSTRVCTPVVLDEVPRRASTECVGIRLRGCRAAGVS